MKKILKLIFLISIFSLALVGCGVKSADNVIDKIAKSKKIALVTMLKERWKLLIMKILINIM